MDMAAALQRLRTDNTSGATTLADLALDMLVACVSRESVIEPTTLRRAVEECMEAIIAAQPSMAPQELAAGAPINTATTVSGSWGHVL